jgi:hypothetical protein
MSVAKMTFTHHKVDFLRQCCGLQVPERYRFTTTSTTCTTACSTTATTADVHTTTATAVVQRLLLCCYWWTFTANQIHWPLGVTWHTPRVSAYRFICCNRIETDIK